MTFSIVARCKKTGQFGAAICSSSPAVGARCLQARAGIGVAASQNITDPQLANILLDMVTYDVSPQDAIQELVFHTNSIEYRQLLLINSHDTPAAYTGAGALGIAAHCIGIHAACAGNLLAHADVPTLMLDAFQTATGELSSRLIEALAQGLQAGGEAGPVHSAALLVVDRLSWPMVDLRVDWSEQPIEDLSQLWQRYAPQVNDYLVRAQYPAGAPRYAVPGDE
jgi:uncharacterized Ntn-hydrolase superfamily protein